MLLYLPIKILKDTNGNTDLDDDIMTANNFFAHWLKGVDTKS